MVRIRNVVSTVETQRPLTSNPFSPPVIDLVEEGLEPYCQKPSHSNVAPSADVFIEKLLSALLVNSAFQTIMFIGKIRKQCNYLRRYIRAIGCERDDVTEDKVIQAVERFESMWKKQTLAENLPKLAGKVHC